jgi:hypothetical protein
MKEDQLQGDGERVFVRAEALERLLELVRENAGDISEANLLRIQVPS